MYKYIWYFNLVGAIINFVLFLVNGFAFNLFLTGLGIFILCITYKPMQAHANRDKYVFCSKCNDQFLKDHETFTSGYYDCSEGYWSEISGITGVLCDNCMWHNEGYIKRYGKVAPSKVQTK